MHVGHVTQWPLPSASSGCLTLSVPTDHAEVVAGTLARARAAGSVDSEAVELLVKHWDFVPGFWQKEGTAQPEPLIILPHRQSVEAIHISSWLNRKRCDPATLFGFREGERVEVEYEGEWYTGDILSIDAETCIARIHCDVDPSDVVTEAHTDSVRRLTLKPSAHKNALHNDSIAVDGKSLCRREPRISGHRRTRSSL